MANVNKTRRLSSCCTDTNATGYQTTWIIQKLSICDEDALESCRYVDDTGSLGWHYKLYSRAYDEAGMHFVKLEFVIDACDRPTRLVLRVEVLNAKEERKDREYRIDAVPGGCKTMLYCNRREDRFFDGDNFTINFEVIVVAKTQCQKVKPKIVHPESQLIPNLARLLQDQTFSDITIVVGGREFLAHKAILAARSKVFAAMFTHDMIESKLERVQIQDCKPVIFEALLRFIYTETVPDLDSMTIDLLRLADKYDLEVLKALCEQSLCDRICEQTVIETLIAADLFRGQQLKREAICYIARNGAVMETDVWRNMWISHFDLANEVVREVMQQQRKG